MFNSIQVKVVKIPVFKTFDREKQKIGRIKREIVLYILGTHFKIL